MTNPLPPEVSTERLREMRAVANDGWMPASPNELIALCDLVLAQREQKAVAWRTEGWVMGSRRICGQRIAVLQHQIGVQTECAESDLPRVLAALNPTSQLRDKCAELVREWHEKEADRTIDKGCREMYGECADELAALLESTP